MTRRCTVKECPSVSGRQRGVSFHTFPNNPIYRQIWLTNCGLPDTQRITKNILVCSRHFRPADYESLQPLKTNQYLLKQGAFPTIFPWGTLPYVEPKPHTTIESDRIWLTSFLDDKSTEISQNVFDETVKIKSELSPAIGVKRSASADEPGRIESNKIRFSLDCKQLKNESADTPTASSIFDQFLPGIQIEAQDFNEVWHYAKVMEVDMEEKEVLICLEKNTRQNIKPKAPPTAPEWISMNSSRLRPLQTLKQTIVTYVLGDRCSARWTDSRKFPATVQKVLGNNTYEVLFDDGFTKVVKGRHMSKSKSKLWSVARSVVHVHPINAHLPIPKFDLSKLNLLPVPRDGEWCCNWVNGIPIGAEGCLNGPGGPRPTVVVEDWRLPRGWTKHLHQHCNVSGKWDVVLVGPTKKRFRSKNEIKLYLERKGKVYNPDMYDFSVHKRRAKNIGLFVFTEEYKEELKNKKLLAATSTDPSTSLGLSSIAANTSNNRYVPTTPLSVPAPSNSGFVYVGALKVELIDNLFRCPEETCSKNFRKENHLQIHVKHCHEDLAKLVGVCPNMADLAYQRTVGQPINESIQKNQIANSQFFETVYLPDLIPTTETKSMSPSTPVKVEENSPSFDEKVNILSLPTGDIKIEPTEHYELTIDSIEPTFQVQEFIGHSTSTSLPIKSAPMFSLPQNTQTTNMVDTELIVPLQ